MAITGTQVSPDISHTVYLAGREQAWFDVFAWAGRDLYRPGETMRVSAILRDNDGKPTSGPTKGGQPVFLRLKQPDGKTFLETRLQPDAQGYVLRPNVDTLVEAMDMREAQRAYEANLNVIETARTMESRTLDILKR